MENIVYSYDNGSGKRTYLNITNKCCCACEFCIRNQMDGIGSAENLWLEHEPEFNEIKKAIKESDFSGCEEAVFCGYGEPTMEIEKMLQTAAYLKEKYPKIKIRLNTNGLCDLINGQGTAERLVGYIDSVSISLNAPNSETYQRIVRPAFGSDSYPALLKFAKDCVRFIKDVRLSVVDTTITEEETEACRKVALSMGVPLRIRRWNA